jgi:hypothetical protein
MLLIICLVLGVIFYFLPAFIASSKKHPNAMAIAVLDLFLGWTFLGWVIALVWAFTGQSRNEISQDQLDILEATNPTAYQALLRKQDERAAQANKSRLVAVFSVLGFFVVIGVLGSLGSRTPAPSATDTIATATPEASIIPATLQRPETTPDSVNVPSPTPEAEVRVERAQPVQPEQTIVIPDPNDEQATLAMNYLQDRLGKPHVKSVWFDVKTDSFVWVGPKYGKKGVDETRPVLKRGLARLLQGKGAVIIRGLLSLELAAPAPDLILTFTAACLGQADQYQGRDSRPPLATPDEEK